MSTTQKKQHFVWRYHLAAWAADGSVHWHSLKQKKGAFGSPASLAYGKYFYKSTRLSDVEKKYMEVFIEKLPDPGMRDVLTRQLNLFQAPHLLRELLDKRSLTTPESVLKFISDETEIFDKTIGENWHGGIESRAIPLLNMLRNRDASFWNEASQSSFFLYFLCHQFFRTPKFKHIYEEAHRKIVIPGLEMSRIWVIESLMYSTIFGANLFVERNRYKIDFINNDSDIGFITSDQPIINLNTPHDKDVCLYYPLTPILAMRLSTNDALENNQVSSAKNLSVEYYNYSIYRACFDNLFGISSNYLATLAQLPRDFES